MIDPMLIGFCQNQPKRNFCTYLGWDKGSAMADFILSRYGFEVPISYTIPVVKELIKTEQWPHRFIVGDMS